MEGRLFPLPYFKRRCLHPVKHDLVGFQHNPAMRPAGAVLCIGCCKCLDLKFFFALVTTAVPTPASLFARFPKLIFLLRSLPSAIGRCSADGEAFLSMACLGVLSVRKRTNIKRQTPNCHSVRLLFLLISRPLGVGTETGPTMGLVYCWSSTFCFFPLSILQTLLPDPAMPSLEGEALTYRFPGKPFLDPAISA